MQNATAPPIKGAVHGVENMAPITPLINDSICVFLNFLFTRKFYIYSKTQVLLIYYSQKSSLIYII
ncbi:MAG UNVERIFIED_CONTAM: hypothetical protein LVQ98_03400 [Rickettsiaceae bacterium]